MLTHRCFHCCRPIFLFHMSNNNNIEQTIDVYTFMPLLRIFFFCHCRQSNLLECRSPSIRPTNNVLNEKRTVDSSTHTLFTTKKHLPIIASSPSTSKMTAICENSQSSIDDIGSTDDIAIGIDAFRSTSSADPNNSDIQLSKKAIHQRDADENLFLRFLELDPPDSTPPSVPQTPAVDRRKSMYKTSAPSAASNSSYSSSTQGRTPFTITKKLIRTAEKGFGFSIVWTHPPRIEKVEPGLSADRSGIFPGDYVIFVDKHNVVTMPEMDILNLIRSQGNTLLLEIFRRSGGGGGASSIVEGGSKRNISTNSFKSRVPHLQHDDDGKVAPQKGSIVNAIVAAAGPVPIASTPTMKTSSTVIRPSTACSNTSLSMESTKRRLHLPQVTFSKDVSQCFP